MLLIEFNETSLIGFTKQVEGEAKLKLQAQFLILRVYIGTSENQISSKRLTMQVMT